jgi:hypothetical protein
VCVQQPIAPLFGAKYGEGVDREGVAFGVVQSVAAHGVCNGFFVGGKQAKTMFSDSLLDKLN